MWTTASMAGDPMGARGSKSGGLVGRLPCKNDNGMVIGKTNGPFTVGGLPRLSACPKAPMFLPQATQQYLCTGQQPRVQHQGYSMQYLQYLQRLQQLQQLQQLQLAPQVQQVQQLQHYPTSQSAVYHQSAVMPQSSMGFGSTMAMPQQYAYIQQPQQLAGLIRSSSLATPSSLGLNTGYNGAVNGLPVVPWGNQQIAVQQPMALPTMATSNFAQPGYAFGYY